MSFLKKIKSLPRTNLSTITTLPEVVFFDYDGTICDNSKYLVKAFNYAVKINFDKKKDKLILKEIKKIKKDSEKWVYIKQKCSSDVFAKCNKDYDTYISNQKFNLIQNVMKIIKLLKRYNIPMFIISQKRGDGLREELEKAKLNKYFQNTYGTLDFDELQKPSKDFIEKVQKHSKTNKKKCWMIGDRYSDVISGIHMNSMVFIINKNDAKKIYEDFPDLIGKQIFFTSYIRLIFHLIKLHRKQKHTLLQNIS